MERDENGAHGGNFVWTAAPSLSLLHFSIFFFLLQHFFIILNFFHYSSSFCERLSVHRPWGWLFHSGVVWRWSLSIMIYSTSKSSLVLKNSSWKFRHSVCTHWLCDLSEGWKWSTLFNVKSSEISFHRYWFLKKYIYIQWDSKWLMRFFF
jgi:hypothetical protein